LKFASIESFDASIDESIYRDGGCKNEVPPCVDFLLLPTLKLHGRSGLEKIHEGIKTLL
jgi:hypothetical protein